MKGKRKAWVGARGRFELLPVYDRYRLAIGAAVRGPAIVEERESTIVIPPRSRALVDEHGDDVPDAVARLVEAAEGAGEAAGLGQERLFWHLDIVEDDLAGDRGAKAHLALDRRRRETLGAALDEEAVDALVLELGPDHGEIGDRRIGNPHLRAIEHESATDALGPGLHAARIGAEVRLGEAERAEKRLVDQRRQPRPLLLLSAGDDHRPGAEPAAADAGLRALRRRRTPGPRPRPG